MRAEDRRILVETLKVKCRYRFNSCGGIDFEQVIDTLKITV